MKTQGITVSKKDFSEWYSQVCLKADLADVRFGIQGFIVHKPWGYRIIRHIYEYLEREVELQGHEPILFPRAVKESHLNAEAEHAGFTPEVMWVSQAGDSDLEERFALPPTGEAQIYPMFSLWLRSHNELPYKVYQSRISTFRYEMSTRPFLRGREFCFFETHNAYAYHSEALEQIEQDFRTCEKVMGDVCRIPFKYFKRPEWDKFLGADATYCADGLMPDGKRTQLASTHDLGQRFAEAYDIKVKNAEGNMQLVYQTCFGPGIWRIMASIIGVHGDDNGLCLPVAIAPLHIVIVPILKKGDETVLPFVKNLEKVLRENGYRVKLDLRNRSPGNKFHEWELKGVPLRIEVGPRDVGNKEVVLAPRIGDKETVCMDLFDDRVPAVLNEYELRLSERAEGQFNDCVREASSLDELNTILQEHRGFVKVPVSSIEEEMIEDKIKDKTGARVCGTLYPEPEPVTGQDCIVTGEKAKHIVYVCKSH